MKNKKIQKENGKKWVTILVGVLLVTIISACGQGDDVPEPIAEVSQEEGSEISGSFVLDATVEIEMPRVRTNAIALNAAVSPVDLSLVENATDVLVKPVVIDVGPKGFVFVEKYLDELPAGLVRIKKTSGRDSLRFSASYDSTQFPKISGGIGFVLLNPGNKKITIKAEPNKKGKRVVNAQDKKELVKETVAFNNFKHFLNSVNERNKSSQSFSAEGKAEVVAATIQYIEKKSQDGVTDEELQEFSSEVSQEDVSEVDAIFDLCEKVDQLVSEQMSTERLDAISGKIAEDYAGFLQSIQPYVIEEEVAPVLTQQSAPTEIPTEILSEPVISEEILVADRATESSLQTSVSSDVVVVIEPLVESVAAPDVVSEPVIAESVVVVEEVIEPVVVAEVALVTEPVVESVSDPVVISDPEPAVEAVVDAGSPDPQPEIVPVSDDEDDDADDNDSDDDEDDDDDGGKKDKKPKKSKDD